MLLAAREKKKRERERENNIQELSNGFKIIFFSLFCAAAMQAFLFVCIKSIRYLLCFCTKNKDAFINSQKSVGQTIHAVKPPKPLSANNEIHQ